MNHAVIWNADESLARALTAGVEMNQHAPLHIVCASEQRAAFAGQNCYAMPTAPASEDAWEQVIQPIFVSIAQSSAPHIKPGMLVLHFVVSAAHCGYAYDQLCALLKGAAKISGMHFSVHILLLQQTVSAYAAQQKSFLQALKQDVEQKSQDCPWSRLTVLSNWSHSGSGSKTIAQNRADILYGVLCEAEPPQGRHECLTYRVRQSNFSRRDVQNLPKQKLYKVICEQRETGSDADRAFKLDLGAVADLIPLEKTALIIVPALLADDDNYAERTGDELLEEFLKYNDKAFIPHGDIQQLADQWLLNAKKQLACWIDVDQTIRNYIKPGADLETKIDANIETLDAPPQSFTKVLRFGHKIPLRQRRGAARDVAERFVQRVIQLAQVEYLKAIKARLPQLNAYLTAMDEANLQYFGPQTDLVEAFKDDKWSSDIQQTLERFEMDRLFMDDAMVDQYPRWLEDSLEKLFFSNLPQGQARERQAAENAFITKATAYLPRDPDASTARNPDDSTARTPRPYVILNDHFTLAQDEQPAWQVKFLGASSRLYLLDPIRWDIKESDIPSAFMTGAELVAAAAEQKVKCLAPPENQGTEVDMTIRLEQKGSICTLSWYWPKNTSSLKLTITDKNGTLGEYSEDVRKPKSGNKSALKLPPESLPFGDTVCIRLEAPSKMYSEKEFSLSQVKQTVYGKPVPRWFMSPMSRHYVDIAGKATYGVAQGRYVLALHQDHYVFKYPVPADKEQMIVLCEANREWQSMQLVLEGK